MQKTRKATRLAIFVVSLLELWRFCNSDSVRCRISFRASSSVSNLFLKNYIEEKKYVTNFLINLPFSIVHFFACKNSFNDFNTVVVLLYQCFGVSHLREKKNINIEKNNGLGLWCNLIIGKKSPLHESKSIFVLHFISVIHQLRI